MTLMDLPADGLSVVVFGPGYGEAIAVRTPGGNWLAVDSCRDQGRTPTRDLIPDGRLSYAVLTHPHEDHAKGFADIVRDGVHDKIGCASPRVKRVDKWEDTDDDIERSRKSYVDKAIRTIANTWEESPDKEWNMRRGDVEHVDGVRVTVLHPDDASVEQVPDDPNLLSTPLVIEWEGNRILLGAEIPTNVWDDLPEAFSQLADHDVLKIPHHGSKRNVSLRFADASEAQRERNWILTPWKRGPGLPQYHNESGLSWLLKKNGKVYATWLPELEDDSTTVATDLRELRERKANPTTAREIDGVPLRSRSSDESGGFRRYVAVRFSADGEVDVDAGHGSVIIRDEVVSSGADE